MLLESSMQKNYNLLIEKFLQIYPKRMRQFLRKDIVFSKEKRFAGKESVEGSYDLETRQIILWNPTHNEEDLFLILTHEWGHKFYHEWLSEKQRAEWLKVRSYENIDFDLKSTYSYFQIPEEEYCTVFSLVSLVLYWSKMNMKKKSQKLHQKIKQEFPEAARTIERHLNTKTSHKSSSSPSSDRSITRREVEALKNWIHKAIEE